MGLGRPARRSKPVPQGRVGTAAHFWAGACSTAHPVAVYPRLQQRPDEDMLGGPRVPSCPQSLSVLRDEPFQPQLPSLVLSSELKVAAVGPGLMKWGTFGMVLLITLKA